MHEQCFQKSLKSYSFSTKVGIRVDELSASVST